MKQAQVSVTPCVLVCVCVVLVYLAKSKRTTFWTREKKLKTEAGTASTSAATSPQAHLAICINNWTFDFKHF